MPLLIDKIKQKNNGTFKLMDAVDVEMPDGKNVADAIAEVAENAGGGTVGSLIGTTADITALDVFEAINEGKLCYISYEDVTYGKITFSNFAVVEGMDFILASTYLATDFGIYAFSLIGSTENGIWSFVLNSLARKDELPKQVVAVDLSGFESDGVIVERYLDATSLTYNFEFDENGNPVKITDSNGRETVLTW